MTQPDPTICPHCNRKMSQWRAPATSSWGFAVHYVCFNDECSYYVRGWEHTWKTMERKASYRHHYDPDSGEMGPIPVWSADALKEKIIVEKDGNSDAGQAGVVTIGKNFQKMKREILETNPRLSLEDEIDFKCNPSVPCFTNCCADINIFLTPYDLLRLKRRLNVSSEDFINQYTLMPPVNEQQRIPILVIKMKDDERKSCPFLGEGGCTVYDDRPWACRMYPVGLASQKTEANPQGEEFYFLLKETWKCQGHDHGQRQKLGDYLKSQGVADYDRMNDLYKDLTLHPFFRITDQVLPPQQYQMFYMACYNQDMFRRFLLNSRFEIMEGVDGVQERIRNSDEELLKFAFEWLRYSLFGEGHIRVRHDIVMARRREVAAKEMEENRRQAEEDARKAEKPPKP